LDFDNCISSGDSEGGKNAESVPRPRVWWLGRERSAANDDGATGGMSAIILRAHYIAAAKVRLQSLEFH